MSFYTEYGYNQPAWDSEYDSTWEEDEENKEPMRKKKNFFQGHQRSRAARDLQNYRHGYPDDSPKPNLEFYQNKIRFKPNGEYIDIMHTSWHNDYTRLERNHSFIQWLFPLRERGVNPQATPLTLSEIQLMKMYEKVMNRFLESYKLMLGFYGIVLLDPETGNVARAEENWKSRFDNLNHNTHNNLRITRILKCLGEMGYEKFQAPLVKFFLEETLCNNNLPNVKISALDYFVFTVKSKAERQQLLHFAWKNYKPQNQFIWAPVEELEKFDDLLKCKDEKNVSLEDNSVEGNEALESKTGFGYSLLLRLFRYLTFFSVIFWPVKWPFMSFISRFRGKPRNKAILSDSRINSKTEGTRVEESKDVTTLKGSLKGTINFSQFSSSDKEDDAENLKIWKIEDNERKNLGHKTGTQRILDENSVIEKAKDNRRNLNDSHKENIGAEATEPEKNKKDGDLNPPVSNKMPESIQDNYTEKKYDTNDSQSNNVKELEKGSASEDEWVKGTGERSEQADNATDKGQNSEEPTVKSELPNPDGDRDEGTENQRTSWLKTENQLAEQNRYNRKTDDEGTANVSQFFTCAKKDDVENLKIWEIKDNERKNLGDKTGIQHILSDKDIIMQTERHDGTEDQETTSLKPLLQSGGKVEEDGNSVIEKAEDNRRNLIEKPKDSDEENIGAETSEPEENKKDNTKMPENIQDNTENKYDSINDANDSISNEYEWVKETGERSEQADNATDKGQNSEEPTVRRESLNPVGDRDEGRENQTELEKGSALEDEWVEETGERSEQADNATDKGQISDESLNSDGGGDEGTENQTDDGGTANVSQLFTCAKEDDAGICKNQDNAREDKTVSQHPNTEPEENKKGPAEDVIHQSQCFLSLDSKRAKETNTQKATDSAEENKLE